MIAKHLAWWAEHLRLFDENQTGFRKGKSTADTVQMMVMLQEDAVDCRRKERKCEWERMNGKV